MKFEVFKQTTLEELNWYFQFIQYYVVDSWNTQLKEGNLLFPNLIVFTETNDHFIFELFGSDKIFTGLKEKNHKDSSTISYLSQSKFLKGGEERFTLTGKINGGISGFFIRREVDYEILKERFPFCEKLWTDTAQIVLPTGDGSYFKFDKDFENCYMHNCILGNRFGNIHRIKHILFIAISNKLRTEKQYRQWLNESLCIVLLQRIQTLLNQDLQESRESINPLICTQFCTNQREEAYRLASQFANLFLTPGVKELTIGEFLNKHPDFIKKVFSCKSFLYQPKLDWIEGNPDESEKAIIPDLMLERDDGYFDICDLKLPKLERESITQGERRRRRFIQDVEEGFSQLANYQDYFNFEKNREFAWSKYKIKISNPRLTLVLGNYDNANREKIQEASRKYQGTPYNIIDYDTLNSFLLKS
jgi:hypothetical protein